jgi:hypothetical protein
MHLKHKKMSQNLEAEHSPAMIQEFQRGPSKVVRCESWQSTLAVRYLQRCGRNSEAEGGGNLTCAAAPYLPSRTRAPIVLTKLELIGRNELFVRGYDVKIQGLDFTLGSRFGVWISISDQDSILGVGYLRVGGQNCNLEREWEKKRETG